MGLWFSKNNKWDYELERNQRWMQQEAERLNDPSLTEYDSSWLYEATEYEPTLLETITELANLILPLILFYLIVDKYFIKKDYQINNKEVIFVFLFLLKIMIPELGIVLVMLSLPKIIKNTHTWFKNNTNKRAELEAELLTLKNK